MSKADQDPIDLDGRTLEGGGQLLRNALTLSALAHTPIRITNIRGNRSGGGGLKAQHLACVNWLARATNAHVEGAEKGSKTLLFRPTKAKHEELSPTFTEVALDDGRRVYACQLDIGTAGSTGLALQAVLPWILFFRFPKALPVRLSVSGGTNVDGSPSYDYIKHNLLPTLARIGLPNITATLTKRGWNTGGTSIGSFTLEIPPRETLVLPKFIYGPSTTSPPPKPTHIRAIFLAPSTLHQHITSILPTTLHSYFPSLTPNPSSLTITTESSLSEKRLYLLLIAHFHFPSPNETHTHTHTLASDHLHTRKIRSPERSATETIEVVCSNLARECASGAWVDEHLRDQMVIFQALAQGRCEVYPGRETQDDADDDSDADEDKDDSEALGELREPSLHARTAEWVAKTMLGVKFDSEGVCDGIGFGAVGNGDRDREDAMGEVTRGVGEVSLAS